MEQDVTHVVSVQVQQLPRGHCCVTTPRNLRFRRFFIVAPQTSIIQRFSTSNSPTPSYPWPLIQQQLTPTDNNSNFRVVRTTTRRNTNLNTDPVGGEIIVGRMDGWIRIVHFVNLSGTLELCGSCPVDLPRAPHRERLSDYSILIDYHWQKVLPSITQTRLDATRTARKNGTWCFGKKGRRVSFRNCWKEKCSSMFLRCRKDWQNEKEMSNYQLTGDDWSYFKL